MKVPDTIRRLGEKFGATGVLGAIADMLDAEHDINGPGRYNYLLREALALLKLAAKIRLDRPPSPFAGQIARRLEDLP